MVHDFNNLVSDSETLGNGVQISYETNARSDGRNFRVSIFISHFGEEVNRKAFEASFDSGISEQSDRNRMIDFINNSVNNFVSNNSELINVLKNVFSPSALSIIERMMNRIENLEDKVNDLERRLD